jgi:hypothetical protein
MLLFALIQGHRVPSQEEGAHGEDRQGSAIGKGLGKSRSTAAG